MFAETIIHIMCMNMKSFYDANRSHSGIDYCHIPEMKDLENVTSPQIIVCTKYRVYCKYCLL